MYGSSNAPSIPSITPQTYPNLNVDPDDRGYGTGPDDDEINAPAEFVARFEAWLDRYEDNYKCTFDLDSFDKEGRALAAELKKIVGPDIKVTFKSEASFSDVYDGPDEEEMP